MSFQHDGSETATASFDVSVEDGNEDDLTPTSSTFNFTVTTTNEPPIASPVTLAAIAEDSGGRLITQAELLAGVIDPDGPSLTITALSIAGGSGTLVDNGDGTWTYTPALNDDTAVSFNYTVFDGFESASSTASLDITPVDDAPDAGPVTLTAIAEDSGTRTITQAELLVGVSDVDGGASPSVASLVIASGNGTLVANEDGTWSYTPASNDDTSVSFTYTLSTGASSTATLDITPVNELPVLTGDLTAAVLEGGVHAITGSDLGFTDPDDGAADVIFTVSNPVNGTVLVNGEPATSFTGEQLANGLVSFQHDGSETATASFDVSVEDGNEDDSTSTSSTFNFTVTTTNEPPIASPVTLAAIAEDSGGRLITQAELLAGVIDPDGPSLTITALSIAGGSGTLVDNGDGTWTYTPALNDDTAVSFNYTVFDGFESASSTASLDITLVDDAPDAGPVTLTAIAEDSGTRTITQAELLVGVSDVDGGASPSVASLVIASGNGTLVANEDGTWSYTPASNDDTSVSFTYTLSTGASSTADTRHYAGE